MTHGRVISWRAAELGAKTPETQHAATLFFDIEGWPGHRAGQHVDVRLTADDGYQASRSYSIGSPPEDDRLALTVERIDEGEVSPYLVDVMEPGDVVEVRGPVGGWFTWDASDGGPLLLIAGGSGLVPLMAMLRHRAVAGVDVPARLLCSTRSLDDLLFARELERLGSGDGAVETFITLTRNAPPDWQGYRRRIDRALLDEVAWAPDEAPRSFVCGPTAFVETAADILVDIGHDPALVKTERFGPTGAS